MEPEKAAMLLRKACIEMRAFAPGWNKRRLVLRT
jgi:hypothetical protein